ncbi:MAG: radical SAM protein [Patescibacteria group bacterium]|jgi:radical SAM superfamily enzyme YgiQ (UPF0313 family)
MSNKLKILLINPPRFNRHPMVREMRCAGLATSSIYPPIELAYLAGRLRREAEVKILDANALNFNLNQVKMEIQNFQPNAVIFTTSPVSFAVDAQIAEITKKINSEIKTILLDSHIVPVMPEKIREKFPWIDYLIGTDPLVNIPKIFGLEGIIGLENQPLPAYDLLPLNKYFSLTYSRKKPFATLITSVGCPNRCKFCLVGGATVKRGYGNRWQFKSAKKILTEIKYLISLGIKNIYFFDETFTVSKERVIELCDLIKKEKIKIDWAANGRVDTLDEETIKIMKAAGCWNIMFGIECGSESELLNMQKGTTLERAMKVVGACKANGINVSASFVIGLPEETRESVEKTIAIAKKINPYRAQFVIATPYPGTKLYDEMKAEGLLLKDYDFSGFDAYCAANQPAIKTRQMGPEELLQAQKYAYRKFYFRPRAIMNIIFSLGSFSQFFNMLKAIKYFK